MNKDLNYATAFEELQQIVAELEKGEVSVDELAANVKRATQLIAVCKTKLMRTEEDVNNILKELEKTT